MVVTGDVNYEGRVSRKFLTCGIAVNYLRIKDEPSLAASDKAVVERWLNALGRLVQWQYVNPPYDDTNTNHMYIAGAGMTAAWQRRSR